MSTTVTCVRCGWQFTVPLSVEAIVKENVRCFRCVWNEEARRKGGGEGRGTVSEPRDETKCAHGRQLGECPECPGVLTPAPRVFDPARCEAFVQDAGSLSDYGFVRLWTLCAFRRTTGSGELHGEVGTMYGHFLQEPLWNQQQILFLMAPLIEKITSAVAMARASQARHDERGSAAAMKRVDADEPEA